MWGQGADLIGFVCMNMTVCKHKYNIIVNIRQLMLFGHSVVLFCMFLPLFLKMAIINLCDGDLSHTVVLTDTQGWLSIYSALVITIPPLSTIYFGKHLNSMDYHLE